LISASDLGLNSDERIGRSHSLRVRANHYPGSVQPHGVLLALRGNCLTAVQASANLRLFLGVAPSVMLGQPLWFEYTAWDEQFYPDGIRTWFVKAIPGRMAL
jgi:hypothetical protein